MFEDLVNLLGKGVYKVFSSDFEEFELIDVMAPSFLMGKEGSEYVVVFDPRSVMAGGFYEEDDDPDVKEYFKRILDEDVKVLVNREGSIEYLKEDVNFYQEMGTMIIEDSNKKINESEMKKIVDRFKMFKMIAYKTREDRFSIDPNMISISPGMAGLSLFFTLDTKFMIWLRNETGLEGEKFKFSLIRIFNVVAANLARCFGYERMMILPYESLVVLNRDVEKLKRFLSTLDVVNREVREFLAENFRGMVSGVKGTTVYEIADIFKSKDAFFEYLAALPDKKAFEHFKEKLLSSIESFSSGLGSLSDKVQKWIEERLKEVC